jgi:hypothetical protein
MHAKRLGVSYSTKILILKQFTTYDLMTNPKVHAIALKWKRFGVKIYYIDADGALKEL